MVVRDVGDIFWGLLGCIRTIGFDFDILLFDGCQEASVPSKLMDFVEKIWNVFILVKDHMNCIDFDILLFDAYQEASVPSKLAENSWNAFILVLCMLWISIGCHE